MRPPPTAFSLSLILLLLLSPAASAATPSPTPSPTSSPTPPTSTSSSSTLDPKELQALESLNIPTTKDPCRRPSTATYAVTCDSSSPFRHVATLSLSNCSSDLTLSSTALHSLSALSSLSFLSCPSLPSPPRFPSALSYSLRSFSAVSSFKRGGISAIFLSRFVNLTDLTVVSVPVSTSKLYVILGNMHKISSLTISNANLTGSIPKHLHLNLTHVDLSNNQLKGKIPTSITLLENLQHLNLSRNALTGEIPTEFGDLISLKNLSLASNSLSGSIPDSISAIPGLTHVDLSGNQLNGTVPRFFSDMKHLKHLNLAGNAFHGVLPFNASFLKTLEVFKIGDNSNLCYNRTVLSSKLKLGIAPCDKHGLPMSPPPQKDTSESATSDYDDENADDVNKKEEHHGPNKVVLGVAIGLSSIVFLIVFLILLSKWCG